MSSVPTDGALRPAPALGTAATPAAPPAAGTPSRRRAWLLLAVVGLVSVLYLTGWSLWAYTHTASRYALLPPGAPGVRGGADFRLLSLTRSEQLADSGGGDPQVADAGATFVVAEVEVVRQREDETFLCAVDLLGPDQRLWTATTVQVQRSAPSCVSDVVHAGSPRRFEAVFLVPEQDADRLVGVALTDRSGPRRSPVLRPPG